MLHHHAICERTTASMFGLFLNTVTILLPMKLCYNLPGTKDFLSLSIIIIIIFLKKVFFVSVRESVLCGVLGFEQRAKQ